ncbi:MAG: CPBP family intramembrane metalloprotease [Novosphingobium sp.]|uniref:CPBP family intramembrane glutamic endopeptidase n=1 Tax=Novosphingobium sp. TaxID=1874826 RepID=UPI001D4B86C7|nr:CPBP family intramembrane glutamic endopeptidase [Novosphingobium sp.]MCB2058354.1 CPBP family intramembrane metalloprotease [Novosphingobium sp.]MCP5385252.1 CPBP family intramembrane metalloprotease [Novosphingobium sp.]
MSELIHQARPGLVRRIVAFPLTLLLLAAVPFILLYGGAMVAAASIPQLRDTPGQPLIVLAVVAIAALLWRLFQHHIERREDAELALAGAGRELAQGLGAGFVLFCSVVAITIALGGMKITAINGIGQLWALLAMAIGSGFFEELIFRGILFRQVETMLGSWAALVLTSALFGASHLANPGATWFAAFAIAVEAGTLLGAAYMLTRRLWLVIGIHVAWNFTQGWVFSAPVSGGKAPLGLLVTTRSGPEWLTGGAFGLEASLIALVLATALGLFLLWRAIAAGQLRRPYWL